MLSNAYRVYIRQASAWYNCDVGVIVSNIRVGALLYFDAEVVPPLFSGVRFRLRSDLAGANVTLRCDDVEGLVLASADIKSTEVAEDGEPQWEVRSCALFALGLYSLTQSPPHRPDH